MSKVNGPLKVGIGGPVGAGKTSLTEALCKHLFPKLSMAVISNDIYTIEDAEYLMRAQALPLERIKGVETGGCPHTAIREDASINLLAVEEMKSKFPDLDIIILVALIFFSEFFNFEFKLLINVKFFFILWFKNWYIVSAPKVDPPIPINLKFLFLLIFLICSFV